MESNFDVRIHNIVAFTALGKPVELKTLLKKVDNTEWNPKRFPGLIYRMSDPKASALIFPQGKVVCTGTKSVKDVRVAIRKIVGKIKEAGMRMPDKYSIKVENMVASSKIKAKLNLEDIAFALENSEYEPEQFPGLVYRIQEPRVAFLLFRSGRIICTGARNIKSIHIALSKFKERLEGIGIKVVPDSAA